MEKISLADISKNDLKKYYIGYKENDYDFAYCVNLIEFNGMYYQPNEECSHLICFPINPLESYRFPDAISLDNEFVSIYDLIYNWYGEEIELDDTFLYIF